MSVAVSISFSASGASPGRVDQVQYEASAVVQIDAINGYAVHIALDPRERIESVAIGDSEHWAVTAKDGAHDAFLKPRLGATPTNLAIRTDLRSYSFELRIGHIGVPTFRVEFHYPEVHAIMAKTSLNRKYSMQIGADSERIVPQSAFDDDHFTYLSFATHAEVPAVFEVTGDGEETLVNHHMDGDVLVIHTVTPQLELRLGNAVVSIFRDTPTVKGPDNQSRVVKRLERIDRDIDVAP